MAARARRHSGEGRNPGGVGTVIRRLEKAYPDTKLALNFSSPLELLVALILAAQCTDVKVNEVTARVFKKYRSPADYARAQREELEADIRPTGFYRNKTRAIQTCCQELIDRFRGTVPNRLEDLLTARRRAQDGEHSARQRLRYSRHRRRHARAPPGAAAGIVAPA